MKISNLSRHSGVSVPTIKFYLRENLLPPGALTARNQAEYDDTHLTRLRLIRLLTGIGMMSLASVREVLAAIDNNCPSPYELAQVVNRALLPEHPTASAHAAACESAVRRVGKFLDDVGWQVRPDAPERQSLVQVWTALEGLGVPRAEEAFAPYVDIAQRLAVREIDQRSPAEGAAAVVARLVLFEVAFAIMRRMAYTRYLVLKTDNEGASPAE